MENEIKTSPNFRGYFEESFWKKKTEYGNKPLTMNNILPSLMLLGFGLIPSTLIFILELMHHWSRKRGSVEATSDNHALNHKFITGSDQRAPLYDDDDDDISDTIKVVTIIHETPSIEEKMERKVYPHWDDKTSKE